ncbi:MAG: EamA family transporter, partial [Actinomycetia bacterium]|nr:EamA family transporter [Actinomycetes bacterium]
VHANAAVIVFWRVAFAGIFVIVLLASRRRLGAFFGLPKRRRNAIIAMGALLSVNWMLYLGSLQLTKVSVAVLIGYCGPVFVAVLTPLIGHERFDRRLVAPLVLALGGIAIIVNPSTLSITSPRHLLGAGLALGSAVTYSLTILIGKRLLQGVPATVYTFGEYLGALAVLLPVVVFMKGPAQPVEWGALLVLGVVDTSLTGLLFLSGLRHVRADHAAVLTYAEPVSAIVFSAIFLNEPITLVTALGATLVVAGGAMVARMEPQQGLETPGLVPDVLPEES